MFTDTWKAVYNGSLLRIQECFFSEKPKSEHTSRPANLVRPIQLNSKIAEARISKSWKIGPAMQTKAENAN